MHNHRPLCSSCCPATSDLSSGLRLINNNATPGGCSARIAFYDIAPKPGHSLFKLTRSDKYWWLQDLYMHGDNTLNETRVLRREILQPLVARNGRDFIVFGDETFRRGKATVVLDVRFGVMCNLWLPSVLL